MARFVFNLQPVLDHRIRVEETIQKEMAAIQIQLDQCVGAAERLRESSRQAASEMYERLALGMEEGHRILYTNYLEGAAVEIERLGRMETSIRSRLETVRLRLIEAVKERRVIEEVRKTDLEEWRRLERIEEQKLYDEMGVRSWRAAHEEKVAAEMEA